MTASKRTILAFIASLVLGIVIPFWKGQGLFLSLQHGFIFAIIVTVIVAMLSWGIEIAVKKGYPAWVGFFLVAIFDILGLLILTFLPNRS